MSYFVWESSLETGIDVIDTQHRRIVDYINQLHDTHARKNRTEVGRALDQLIDHTITHFTFEESLMERADYQHVGAHKGVHAAFAERIAYYKRRFDNGDEVANRLLSDLRIWLTNHIEHEDGDYADIVKSHLRKDDDKDKGWLAKTIGRLFRAE